MIIFVLLIVYSRVKLMCKITQMFVFCVQTSGFLNLPVMLQQLQTLCNSFILVHKKYFLVLQGRTTYYIFCLFLHMINTMHSLSERNIPTQNVMFQVNQITIS